MGWTEVSLVKVNFALKFLDRRENKNPQCHYNYVVTHCLDVVGVECGVRTGIRTGAIAAGLGILFPVTVLQVSPQLHTAILKPGLHLKRSIKAINNIAQ